MSTATAARARGPPPGASEEHGDPTLAYSEAAQRRGWAAQRVAWGVMATVLVLAVLGVFGSGPLATGRAGAGETLEVEYPRFARHGAETELTVDVRGAALPLTVALGRDFVDGVQLERDSGVALARRLIEARLEGGQTTRILFRTVHAGDPSYLHQVQRLVTADEHCRPAV